jgi:hypothetical protein
MSPTGGRRPATRSVFAIEDQELLLPDPIALDTSFVVEALLSTQPLHAVCDAFLTRIGDSGVTVVTSDLLAVELAEAALAIALKERWSGRWRADTAPTDVPAVPPHVCSTTRSPATRRCSCRSITSRYPLPTQRASRETL